MSQAMKRIDLAFAALFVPLDYLMLLLAGTAAYALRFAPVFTAFRPVTFELSFSEFLALVLPIAAIYILVFSLSGLYNIRPRSIPGEAVRVIVASAASIAVVLAIAFFSRELFDSRFIVLAAWVFSVVFLLVERLSLRLLQRTLRRFGYGVQYVAVIGKTKNANELVAYFGEHRALGYVTSYHTAHFNNDTADRLKRLKNENKLDLILLANTEAERSEVTSIKTFSDVEHTSFMYTADLFPGSTLRPIVFTFGGSPVIEVPKTPLDGWGAIYKRSFDIMVSLLLIIATLPLQLLIGLAIFIENPGPIFFTIKRVGMRGKPFPFMKFRSMIKNAHKLRFDPKFIEKYGNEREGTPLFKLADDPRVTRVGRFIRKWSLDEIPQFYAVFAGSMSLVGPRPHLPEEVARYKPGERRVLTIKPGISGLSQISGRANLDFEDEVRLDMYYIENWSPWLDLIILIKTPIAVLFRKGAY
jgi:exopolysaccharide biosynthesis polyprenyl glycosylphosphotransferase